MSDVGPGRSLMLPVPVPGSQILGEYPDGLTLRVTSDREVELTELAYLDATEAKPVESNSLHEHGKDFPIPIDYSKLVKINNLMRADGGADMRGRRKQMPLCNGTDTGCVSPIDNITGRESGLTSFRCFTREKRANRHTRQSRPEKYHDVNRRVVEDMIALLNAGFSICELWMFLISKRPGGGRATAQRGNPNRAVHVILKLRSRPFIVGARPTSESECRKLWQPLPFRSGTCQEETYNPCRCLGTRLPRTYSPAFRRWFQPHPAEGSPRN